jgi:hypothetical protein
MGMQGPAGEPGTVVVAGAVNEDGTAQNNSDQFGVELVDDNTYEITFPEGVFPNMPIVTVMPIGGSVVTAVQQGASNGGFFVRYTLDAAAAHTFVAAPAAL